MAMNLYQPVLFVGLGGTGCDIGAELEIRLREEICGPDGNQFRHNNRTGADMLPYQLPSCLQFVYADMNQAALAGMPRRVVPSPRHAPAVLQTAHYVQDLVPQVDSYPELARNLRLEARQVTASWLPPERGEPRVNPLYRGTGQFPTIGRAALFGTLLEDVNPVVRDLHAAIGKLAGSGPELRALGGQPPRGVDVFVAFSVAGGTGSGIFYDYLHLIGDMFRPDGHLRVQIYPLVLMPSAFAPGLGGGRNAELNSGRALLDLFRLVDQQNGADARRELHSSHDQGRPVDPEEQAVRHPKNTHIVLRPGIVQTGFLFSRPHGATREDMHRSIVSLVMSLVGTGMTQDDNRPGEMHQSFADSFVNMAAQRQITAGNGIGSRGVSTALVASLTVPVDDLAGIVGARLLRTAIEELAKPNGQLESNRAEIEDFLVKAHLHEVQRRQGTEFHEPEPVNGARAVTAALNDRREHMKAGLAALKTRLGQDMPRLVAGFDPRGALVDQLGRLDAFHAQRVAFGHPALADDVDKGGVSALLQRRQAAPPAPDGFGVNPPGVPELRDRLLGQVKWADPAPVAARAQQDEWYKWSTQVAWAGLWAAHASPCLRTLGQVDRELAAMTKALQDFAAQDHDDFDRRSADLYRKRVGVSYLLPSGTGKMDHFYGQVIRLLQNQLSLTDQHQRNATEAALLQALIGPDGWRAAYQLSIDEGPERAVTELKDRVKTAVKGFLRDAQRGEQPMIPRLHDLLAEASGQPTTINISRDYLEEFGGKLAGLVPANFTPQGSGQLKILISYPADAPSPVIEQHLRTSVNLPVGPGIHYEYRPIGTESIAVVLFRTSMGVTEVGEVRDVLRLWAGALAWPEKTDLLRWRQRTGYDFGYLATREQHRREILHRLLCALWNGKASVVGPAESPERLNVQLGGVTMPLQLSPIGKASSWGSLLRAFELWALDDDDIHRRFCVQLMHELPEGLEGKPVLPHELYLTVRKLAKGEIGLLEDMMNLRAASHNSRAAQMHGFWATTMDAALDQEFDGPEAPIASTLRQLETETGTGSGE
jgi:hypothetical protein